jgi:hypothetical protein
MGARKSWEAGAADKSGSQGRQKKQGVRGARKSIIPHHEKPHPAKVKV